jgi:putative ABC transport system permease protein
MPYALLFQRIVIRPMRAEPVRTLLTALAVALGVAVVLAIELAGGAAAGSFRSSLETLTGDSDFEVTAHGGITPELLTSLARLPHPLTLRPRIEDYVVLNGRTVPLIGIDVLTDAVARKAGTDDIDAEELGREDAAWAGAGLGVRKGDKVELLVNDTWASVTIRGLLPRVCCGETANWTAS